MAGVDPFLHEPTETDTTRSRSRHSDILRFLIGNGLCTSSSSAHLLIVIPALLISGSGVRLRSKFLTVTPDDDPVVPADAETVADAADTETDTDMPSQ